MLRVAGGTNWPRLSRSMIRGRFTGKIAFLYDRLVPTSRSTRFESALSSTRVPASPLSARTRSNTCVKMSSSGDGVATSAAMSCRSFSDDVGSHSCREGTHNKVPRVLKPAPPVRGRPGNVLCDGPNVLDVPGVFLVAVELEPLSGCGLVE